MSLRAFFTVLVVGFAWPLFAEQPTADQLEFFESKIRPIFVEHCYQCHATGAEDIEGGLVLDSRWGWETGGDSGPPLCPATRRRA